MQVTFDKSFIKSLDKLQHNAFLLDKIKEAILNCEGATGIKDISHIKKRKGFKNNYRIKIGDYRIGLEIKTKQSPLFLLHTEKTFIMFPLKNLYIFNIS